MAPLVVVLVVLVVLVEVVLLVVLARMRKGRFAAEQEAVRLEDERARLAEEAAVLAVRVRDAEALAEKNRQELEHAASVARARADAAERHAADARDRVTRLEDDLAVARTSTADGAMLWDLEMARADRLWHESVSPGIDVPSPLQKGGDRLRAVLTIVVDAYREDSGTQVTLAYDLRHEPPPSAALQVVRAVDALLAPLAKKAEQVAVAVAGDEPCFVHIRAVDGDGHPIDVAVPKVLRSMATSDAHGVTLRCS